MWAIVEGRPTYKFLNRRAIERVQNWHGLGERHATLFDEGMERQSAYLPTLLADDISTDVLQPADGSEISMERLPRAYDLFRKLWKVRTKSNFEDMNKDVDIVFGVTHNNTYI